MLDNQPSRDPNRCIYHMPGSNQWKVIVSRDGQTFSKRFDSVEQARAARDAFIDGVATRKRARDLWAKYRRTKPAKRPSERDQLLIMMDLGIPEAVARDTQ